MGVLLWPRTMIILIVGLFLLHQSLDGLRRGVTSFNITRADTPGRFWFLVLAQLLLSSAMLLYVVVLWRVARGRMEPLGILGL